MSGWNTMKWAYEPMSSDHNAPGDRRRFVFWATRRGVRLAVAEPGVAADITVLSERADPVRWASVPRARTRIVLDLVDAYLAPERSFRAAGRGVFKWVVGDMSRPVTSFRRALQQLCRRADAIVCASEEQAELARPFNGNVHVILDSLSELGDPVGARDRADGAELRLLWEGLPENLAHFREIREPLRALGRRFDLRLAAVSALQTPRVGGRLFQKPTAEVARRFVPSAVVHAWSIASLRQAAAASDVAVIPLSSSSPFARLKPETKLLGFWRLGVPTLTSRTPAYLRCMNRAGLDLTCETPKDWEEKLTRLASDSEARRRSRDAGLSYVREFHSDEDLLRRWDTAFASVARHP